MEPFVIDRAHPPSLLEFRGGGRYLALRPWALRDVDALRQAIAESAATLRPYMPWAHQTTTREEEYAILSRFQEGFWAGREYLFGMFAENGAILGGAGLHPRVPLNPRGLEVGYWCHAAHQRQGWTTLAVRMLTVLAFDHFGCDRLQLLHASSNLASRGVAEKCGFQLEGELRGLAARATPALRAGGYVGDGLHRMYALLPEDLAGLPWLDAVRAGLTRTDALGGLHPASGGAPTGATG
ncbi:MAG: GNAT family protein [Polyangiales bacterium]